jgi:peptidoglycan-N-acetylglucosamine deacetylase
MPTQQPRNARSAESQSESRDVPRMRVLFYAATACAFGLAARSILIEPLPIEVSLAAMGIYVAFLLGGVFILKWRVYVDAIIQGPLRARGIVLTFDDGPDPKHTLRVLDALDAAKVHATFFVIGKKAEKYPEIVREIVKRGHRVGLHAYEHDRLFSLRPPARVKEDLLRGLDVIEKITGERTLLFRPPIGHTNPIIARVVEELDLIVIGWSVSARDGTSGATKEGILRRLKKGIDHGSILLMHDASERSDFEPMGPDALPELLTMIKDEGIEIVPLENWI